MISRVDCCNDDIFCKRFNVDKAYMNGVWEVKEEIIKYNSISHIGCKGHVLRSRVLRPPYTLSIFQEDIRLHKIAADNGLAPRINQVWESEEQGTFVMGNLDFTAKIYIQECMKSNNSKGIKDTIKECKDLIRRLHKLGIFHRDVHLGNFMYDSSTKKWQIVDFERASTILTDFEEFDWSIKDTLGKYKLP